jgi:hypothetical protein
MRGSLSDDRERRITAGESVPVPVGSNETAIEPLRATAAGVSQHLDSCGLKPLDFIKSVKELDRIQANLRPEQKQRIILAAVQMVCNELGIQDGKDLSFDAKLVLPGRLKPIERAPIDQEVPSESAAAALTPEIEKRRLINALLQGRAHAIQYRFLFEDQVLKETDSALLSACRNLMATADAAVLQIDESGINHQHFPTAGISRLDFSTTPITVRAAAIHLPVLIHEIAKGALEALALHGLPQDEAIRKAVMVRTDRPEYEAWGIAIGGELWKQLLQSCPRELDPRGRSEWLQGLFKLPADDFIARMQQIAKSSQSRSRGT